MTRSLLAVALLISSVAVPGCRSLLTSLDVELGDPTVTVPMSHAHGHITVDVFVDGQGPYLFQLDTYASGQAYVDDDFARALGLDVIGTTRNSDGRTVVTRDLVTLERLTLGEAVFTDVTTMVDDYDWIGERDGRKVVGLLGFALFEDLLLTIDYPGSRLELREGALDPDAPHVIDYLDTTGSPDVVVDVAGVPLLVGIDTGHAGTLMLHLTDAEDLALAGPLERAGTARTAYSSFELFAQGLDGTVGLAGHRLSGVDAWFSEGASGRILGHGLVKHFALTFDQEQRLVRVALPGADG